MKRLLDIFISSAVVLIFLPFGMIIAIILKLTGENEIFYQQPRIGKNGEKIKIIKFATMVKNSSKMGAGDITLKNDPRVLPFGKFLRKTKLNEFPQFINVFLGHMSIVGPRPLVENQFNMIPENFKKNIINLKPGITSVGSIIFRDEEKYLAENSKNSNDFYKTNIVPYKSEIENWYFINQSFLLDIKIIFFTAVAIIFPKLNVVKIAFSKLPKNNLFNS